METNTSNSNAPAAGTLGAVLYANPRFTTPETEWVTLLAESGAGDPAAVLALYERTHRPVFTFLVRLVCDRELAEELALDVYAGLLKPAGAAFNPAEGSVMAWVMNRARHLAVARLRSRQLDNREADPGNSLIMIDMPDYRHILHMREQARVLASALASLTAEERAAIDATHFADRDYVQAAVTLQKPAGVVKSSLRSALHKLARGLSQGPEFSSERIFYRVCDYAELAAADVLGALPQNEHAAVKEHLRSCGQCRWEVDALRPIVHAMIAWPTDLLRPGRGLRDRLADRLFAETGQVTTQAKLAWRDPDWENVAPGISCKILAKDDVSGLVSMLVRLVPGGEYPPHTHAAVEELHLLDGELWIDERKLHPGDYNRADPGTGDKRVWSETGCTCVLVTSSRDVLA